jgi:hypothetical protein
VRTLVDARLRNEASSFALRFACDDCAHFDGRGEPRAPGECSLGYPAAPRRDALASDHVELCKTFELA